MKNNKSQLKNKTYNGHRSGRTNRSGKACDLNDLPLGDYYGDDADYYDSDDDIEEFFRNEVVDEATKLAEQEERMMNGATYSEVYGDSENSEPSADETDAFSRNEVDEVAAERPELPDDYLRWPHPVHSLVMPEGQAKILMTISEGIGRYVRPFDMLNPLTYDQLGQIVDAEFPVDADWYETLQKRVRDVSDALGPYGGEKESHYLACRKWEYVERALFALLMAGKWKIIDAALKECTTLNLLLERAKSNLQQGVPLPVLKTSFAKDLWHKIVDVDGVTAIIWYRFLELYVDALEHCWCCLDDGVPEAIFAESAKLGLCAVEE